MILRHIRVGLLARSICRQNNIHSSIAFDVIMLFSRHLFSIKLQIKAKFSFVLSALLTKILDYVRSVKIQIMFPQQQCNIIAIILYFIICLQQLGSSLTKSVPVQALRKKPVINDNKRNECNLLRQVNKIVDNYPKFKTYLNPMVTN